MALLDFLRALLIVFFWVNTPSVAQADEIHDVASLGDVAALTALLDGGADIERESPLGTPLVVAAWAGNVEAVALLLERGASTDAESILGTALVVALQRGHNDVSSLLLSFGTDPDLGTNSKALLIALRKRNQVSFMELLEAGANPDITKGVEGITALHMVATLGLREFLEPLLHAGASPNLLTPKRESALHLALQNGHVDIAASLGPITNVELDVEPIDALMATADAEVGEELAHGMVADCAQCHIMGNRPDTRYLHQGPALWSMEGVARARDPNYDYSMTLRHYGGVWDLDSLNWIMAAPAVAFPGTHKNWYPITDPQIRAHVVAYLRSLGPPPD